MFMVFTISQNIISFLLSMCLFLTMSCSRWWKDKCKLCNASTNLRRIGGMNLWGLSFGWPSHKWGDYPIKPTSSRVNDTFVLYATLETRREENCVEWNDSCESEKNRRHERIDFPHIYAVRESIPLYTNFTRSDSHLSSVIRIDFIVYIFKK